MKRIIDIPNYNLEEVQNGSIACGQILKAVKNSTPVPQGRWIRYRDNPHQPEHIKCSNCGQYWSVADHDKIFDICFKCGAYMREEK